MKTPKKTTDSVLTPTMNTPKSLKKKSAQNSPKLQTKGLKETPMSEKKQTKSLKKTPKSEKKPKPQTPKPKQDTPKEKKKQINGMEDQNTSPERGVKRKFNTNKEAKPDSSKQFTKPDSSQQFAKPDSKQYTSDTTIKVFFPYLKSYKQAFQEFLENVDDLRPASNTPIAVRADDEKIKALRNLRFEGKPLKVIIGQKLQRDPFKRVIRFLNFGVNTEAVRKHFNAIRIEPLPMRGNPRPHYILTFGSEHVAYESYRRPFHYWNRKHFTTPYVVVPRRDEQYKFEQQSQVTEESPLKKLKGDGKKKAAAMEVNEQEQEDDDEEEDEEEDAEEGEGDDDEEEEGDDDDDDDDDEEEEGDDQEEADDDEEGDDDDEDDDEEDDEDEDDDEEVEEDD